MGPPVDYARFMSTIDPSARGALPPLKELLMAIANAGITFKDWKMGSGRDNVRSFCKDLSAKCTEVVQRVVVAQVRFIRK